MSKLRGRDVGTGMEVRIAVWWGEGARGRREEHRFQHVVLTNLLVFSSLVVSSSVSSSPLLAHPVLSVIQERFKEAV